MRREGGKGALRLLGRVGVLLAVLAVGVAALAAVSLKWVFTPERIRFLLIDQLEAALRRPVRMDAVSLNPLGGVRVEGFRILRRDKPWAEPFIASETFLANFQLWPLIAERRLVLDEIWLARPTIQIVRRPDGTVNLMEILASTGTRASPLGPVALSVAQAQLSNGRVVFNDEMDGSRHEFSQIQMSVKDFKLAGPFRFALSFASEHRAGGEALPSAVVDLEARLDLAGLDLARAQCDLMGLTVRAAGWRLSARGYATDFLRPRGAVDADISPAAAGAALPVKRLRNLMLAPLSAQASFAMPDARTLEVKAFQLVDRRSRLEGDGRWSWNGASTTWRVHLRSPGLDLGDAGRYLRDLAPHALGGTLRFETTVSSGPQGLEFGRTSISLEDGRGGFGESAIRGLHATFAAPAGLPVGRLQVSEASARLFGQDLSDFSVDAEIRGPDWTFHRFRGVWNGMRWNLYGKVQDFFRPSHIDIHGGADVIRIQEVVNLVDRILESHKARAGKEAPPRKWFEYVKYGVPKTFPSLAGRLAGRRVEYRYLTGQDFAIRFDVKGMEPGMRNLTGFAQVALGPGRILHTQDMMANSKFLRVIFLPFVTLDKINTMGILKGWKEKDALDYRRIVGDYKATWGNVRVNELVIDTAEILLSANGQIDLPAESIQLYVLNRLYKSKGTLPETLTCDDGKPCLAFFVEGDLGVPDVELDLNKIRTQKGADVLKRRLEQIQILKSIIPTD